MRSWEPFLKLQSLVAVLVACVAGGMVAAIGIGGVQFYGWALFIGVPFVIGLVAGALLPRDVKKRLAIFAAITAAGLMVTFMILAGKEGAVCIGLAAVLGLIPLMAGALIGIVIRRRVLFIWLAVAALAGLEPRMHARPEVFVVEDSMIVRAAPVRTWSTIVSLNSVGPSHDWIFRSGIACPQRTKIVDGRVGGTRLCTMSTGVLKERIDVWQPGHRLAWTAISTPPPIEETNPFHAVDAPHLHGMYRNVQGEFALQAIGGGRTLLTRRTWYEYDMYPAAYWRMWCDFGASRIQRFVLGEVKRAAEEPRI